MSNRQFYSAQCRSEYRRYGGVISTFQRDHGEEGRARPPPDDLAKKIPIANNPHVINGLLDFPVMKNDSIPIMLGEPGVKSQIVAFKVVEIEPEEAVIITRMP